VVSSPPYWGQRMSAGNGVEADPRRYVAELAGAFIALLPKVKPRACCGSTSVTPTTPRSTGDRPITRTARSGRQGWPRPGNSAYAKPRYRRRPFVDATETWLRYGNLLALPQRLVVALSDAGWLFRGEVIWRKKNPMPEGRCGGRTASTRPSISSPAASSTPSGQARPSGPSGVRQRADQRSQALLALPEELPRRCIAAYGQSGPGVIVLDPFSGSGTTGSRAAAGCSYLGFEIDGSRSRRPTSGSGLPGCPASGFST